MVSNTNELAVTEGPPNSGDNPQLDEESAVISNTNELTVTEGRTNSADNPQPDEEPTMVSNTNGTAVSTIEGHTSSEDNPQPDKESHSTLQEEPQDEYRVDVNFGNLKSDNKHATEADDTMHDTWASGNKGAHDNKSYQYLLRRIQKLEESVGLQNHANIFARNDNAINERKSVQTKSIWDKKRKGRPSVRSDPLARMQFDSSDDDDEIVKEEDFDAKYPPDCYSMMALNGPTNGRWADRRSFLYFMFSICVFCFQISLLGLAFFSGVDWLRGTVPENDNPGEDFFGHFIPPNANTVTRATQILSLMVFCIFPEASVQDVVAAIQLFPWTTSGSFWCLRLACTLRWLQGVLAIATVWLLVMSSETVIDIFLNFTAVNFISSLDDTAFSLAESGVFGPIMKVETIRISNTKLPSCVNREKKHVWYWRTLAATFVSTLGLALYVIFYQELSNYWVTSTLRVEFTDKEFRQYSGCFHLNGEAKRDFKRYIYNSLNDESNSTIGYCRPHRQWILFDDTNGTSDPCNARDEQTDKVRSIKTDSFDILATFEEPWVSSSGAPLNLFFFDDDLDDDDLHCDLAFGDGKCDVQFNTPGYSYDEGDCCAATCFKPNCGRGSQATVFGDFVNPQIDFPHCESPDMVPLTIQLNDIKSSRHEDFLYTVNDDNIGSSGSGDNLNDFFFTEEKPEKPYFALECNGAPVFTTYIEKSMVKTTQTVMVEDGATCFLEVKNNTASNEPIPVLDDPIWLVNYTIFHGDKTAVDNEWAVQILTQHSIDREIVDFKRIPDCYLDKLSNFIENKYIYPAVGTPSKAIDWLVKNDTENSQCEDQMFIERYAATKVVFATEKEEFLSIKNQCTWAPIRCDEGSIAAIKLEGDWGSSATEGLPSEIGILTNLNRLELGRNLITSISSEIGLLTNLETILLTENQITSIPTEIGALKRLQYLNLGTNPITSIPSEIGLLTGLTSLKMFSNQLASVPSEIWRLTRLTELWLFDNDLTSIPTAIGQLTNLRILNMRSNKFSSMPTEMGKLMKLKYLNLRDTLITAEAIPSEVDSLQIEFSIEPYPVPGNSVVCQNVPDASQYCDCTGDCLALPQFCQCEEAQAPTCCGGYKPMTCEEGALSNFQRMYLDDYDSDNNTYIDTDEMQEYYSEFISDDQDAMEYAKSFMDYFDTDGNDSVIPEEYANIVCNPPTAAPTDTFSPTESMYPTYSPTTIEICEGTKLSYFQDYMLVDLDTDNSTYIDTDEMQEYYSEFISDDQEAMEYAKRFIDYYDTDGDGEIFGEEYAKVVCAPRVNCGGRSAASCEDCPWDGETWVGEDWCNEECSWRIDSTLDREGECVDNGN